MRGVLPYKWEAYCSTNGSCIVGFPFLQGFRSMKAQRYEWGAYCRTNWRCTAVLSPRPVGVSDSSEWLKSGWKLCFFFWSLLTQRGKNLGYREPKFRTEFPLFLGKNGSNSEERGICTYEPLLTAMAQALPSPIDFGLSHLGVDSQSYRVTFESLLSEVREWLPPPLIQGKKWTKIWTQNMTPNASKQGKLDSFGAIVLFTFLPCMWGLEFQKDSQFWVILIG